MKLYHYVHCPYCIRVRMGLGILKLAYESIVLPYHDEKTPIEMIGVKMLPILEVNNGNFINESLDILKKFDEKDILSWKNYHHLRTEVDHFISTVANPVHSLCMPYWVWTPEFDPSSRAYFQQKKELKKGPFKILIQNKEKYLTELQIILKTLLEENLNPFYKSSSLTIIDIMISSHLWGMYIFPEFQFSEKIHNYLQTVKQQTYFDYHQDFWK